MKYRYIKNNEAFAAYLAELQQEQIVEIGLDLEGEYNLHSYGEKLCLIQIYDGRQPVIVDPFEISAKLMKKFFENKQINKIMFDSSSDQRLLYKQFKIRIFNIFDLKPAVDLLEYKERNLGFLLTDKIGLPAFDKKSFQRYNWQSRPLAEAAIDYAISDVLYLFKLKEIILADLQAGQLLADFQEKNQALQAAAPKINKRPAIFRKLIFISLTKSQREIFQKIYWIREKYAEKLDLPAYRLFSNEKMRKLTVKPHLLQRFETRVKIELLEMEKLRSEIEQVHYQAKYNPEKKSGQ